MTFGLRLRRRENRTSHSALNGQHLAKPTAKAKPKQRLRLRILHSENENRVLADLAVPTLEKHAGALPLRMAAGDSRLSVVSVHLSKARVPMRLIHIL